MRKSIIACGALAASCAVHASSAPALQALDEATGAALQADMPRALASLRRLPAAQFDGEDAALRDCMLRRFDGAAPEAVTQSDPFVHALLDLYRRYWHRALREPSSLESAEEDLLRSLRALLRAAPQDDLDALWPAVERKLADGGWHALGGRTGRLLELMIWRREDVVAYRVQLPEQAQDFRVTQLDDFASLGWSHYATCGRRATGGWAHPDMLFAVMPRYAGGAAGEQFRVSLLGHEAQHAADQARFAKLAPWELEYRAKLTELALTASTRAQILTRFTEDQGDDARSPHSYANKRVLAAMRERLGLNSDAQLATAPIAALHDAATALLRADSARR